MISVLYQFLSRQWSQVSVEGEGEGGLLLPPLIHNSWFEVQQAVAGPSYGSDALYQLVELICGSATNYFVF